MKDANNTSISSRPVSNGMRVLAIDPGYGRCGIAVVEKGEGKEVLLYSACIETPTTMEFADRLRMVIDAFERAILAHAPRAVAMERLFFTNNQKTAMRVAEVRGAVISSAAAAGLTVHEYGPGEIKSATTGDGRADKKQVAAMVKMLVKIDQSVRLDDEYDAIAIALTHLARYRVASAAFR